MFTPTGGTAQALKAKVLDTIYSIARCKMLGKHLRLRPRRTSTNQNTNTNNVYLLETIAYKADASPDGGLRLTLSYMHTSANHSDQKRRFP